MPLKIKVQEILTMNFSYLLLLQEANDLAFVTRPSLTSNQVITPSLLV